MQMRGRRRDIIQPAVNAITQRDLVFKRFNVNIAGPFINGLTDDQVNELDDRGFFRLGDQACPD